MKKVISLFLALLLAAVVFAPAVYAGGPAGAWGNVMGTVKEGETLDCWFRIGYNVNDIDFGDVRVIVRGETPDSVIWVHGYYTEYTGGDQRIGQGTKVQFCEVLEGKQSLRLEGNAMNTFKGEDTLVIEAAAGRAHYELIYSNTYAPKPSVYASNEAADRMRLITDSVIYTPEIYLRGNTAPQSNVVISVDGADVGRVASNMVGRFEFTLPLEQPEDGRIYTVKARLASNPLAAETKYVLYCAEAPQLVRFSMRYTNVTEGIDYELNLLETGSHPYLIDRGEADYSFTLGFSDNNAVEDVYVVNPYNESEAIRATYNAQEDAYFTNGRFRAWDPSYVPETVEARFSPKSSAEYMRTVFFFNLQAEMQKLENGQPALMPSLEATQENGETVYRCKIDDLLAGVLTQRYGDAFTDMLRDLRIRVPEPDGGARMVLEFGSTVIDLATTLGDGSFSTVIGNTAGALQTLFGAEDAFRITSEDAASIAFSTAESVMTIKSVPGAGAAGIFSDLFALIGAEKKNDIWGKGEALIDLFCRTPGLDPFTALLGKAEFCLADLVVNKTLPVYFDNMFDLADRAMRGEDVNVTPDYFFKGTPFEWLIKFACSDCKGLYDPSGFVYDVFEDRRVSGAQVTAYWIPYDEALGEAFWEAPDESKAEIWDASSYSQMNPQIADGGGNYFWDVPAGWWQVCAEKEGYTTAYSAWLPVPPEQTEVNLCLYAASAPTVTEVIETQDGLQLTFSDYVDVSSVNGQTCRFTLPDGGTVSAEIIPQSIRETENGSPLSDTFLLCAAPCDGVAELTVDGVCDALGRSVEIYRGSFVFRNPSENEDAVPPSEAEEPQTQPSHNVFTRIAAFFKNLYSFFISLLTPNP